MGYSKVNWYLIKNPLFIYLLFLITGVIFFWKFNHLITAEPDIIVLKDTIYVYIDSSKTHKMFLDDIGKFESNNDYRKVNRFGYLGKYQFGRTTLKQIDIKCTPQEFIDQPLLQEHAMELNLKYNKGQLSEYIGKYQFTYFRGVYITESGVLAAAHLGGAGSVKTFFAGGKIFRDGNGVAITTYMNNFSGYNLEYK